METGKVDQTAQTDRQASSKSPCITERMQVMPWIEISSQTLNNSEPPSLPTHEEPGWMRTPSYSPVSSVPCDNLPEQVPNSLWERSVANTRQQQQTPPPTSPLSSHLADSWTPSVTSQESVTGNDDYAPSEDSLSSQHSISDDDAQDLSDEEESTGVQHDRPMAHIKSTYSNQKSQNDSHSQQMSGVRRTLRRTRSQGKPQIDHVDLDVAESYLRHARPRTGTGKRAREELSTDGEEDGREGMGEPDSDEQTNIQRRASTRGRCQRPPDSVKSESDEDEDMMYHAEDLARLVQQVCAEPPEQSEDEVETDVSEERPTQPDVDGSDVDENFGYQAEELARLVERARAASPKIEASEGDEEMLSSSDQQMTEGEQNSEVEASVEEATAREEGATTGECASREEVSACLTGDLYIANTRSGSSDSQRDSSTSAERSSLEISGAIDSDTSVQMTDSPNPCSNETVEDEDRGQAPQCAHPCSKCNHEAVTKLINKTMKHFLISKNDAGLSRKMAEALGPDPLPQEKDSEYFSNLEKTYGFAYIDAVEECMIMKNELFEVAKKDGEMGLRRCEHPCVECKKADIRDEMDEE